MNSGSWKYNARVEYPVKWWTVVVEGWQRSLLYLCILEFVWNILPSNSISCVTKVSVTLLLFEFTQKIIHNECGSVHWQNMCTELSQDWLNLWTFLKHRLSCLVWYFKFFCIHSHRNLQCMGSLALRLLGWVYYVMCVIVQWCFFLGICEIPRVCLSGIDFSVNCYQKSYIQKIMKSLHLIIGRQTCATNLFLGLWQVQGSGALKHFRRTISYVN